MRSEEDVFAPTAAVGVLFSHSIIRRPRRFYRPRIRRGGGGRSFPRRSFEIAQSAIPMPTRARDRLQAWE